MIPLGPWLHECIICIFLTVANFWILPQLFSQKIRGCNHKKCDTLNIFLQIFLKLWKKRVELYIYIYIWNGNVWGYLTVAKYTGCSIGKKYNWLPYLFNVTLYKISDDAYGFHASCCMNIRSEFFDTSHRKVVRTSGQSFVHLRTWIIDSKPQNLALGTKLCVASRYTPWSLNRLFKGILNSLVDYFGGVFSTDFTPSFLPASLPNTSK